MGEFIPSLVTRNLYISGIFGVTKKNIDERNIKFVVNITYDIPLSQFEDVRTDRIEIDDLPTIDISAYFDTYTDLIQSYLQHEQGVLVHCMAGISRSSSMCIAFLMKHRGMKLLEAYNHIRACRPMIRPNVGFFQQLIEYERKLYGDVTVKMLQTPIGLIPEVYFAEQDSGLGKERNFHSQGTHQYAEGTLSSPVPLNHHLDSCQQFPVLPILPISQQKIILSTKSPNRVLKPRSARIPSPVMRKAAENADNSSTTVIAVKKNNKTAKGTDKKFEFDSDADDEMSFYPLNNNLQS